MNNCFRIELLLHNPHSLYAQFTTPAQFTSTPATSAPVSSLSQPAGQLHQWQLERGPSFLYIGGTSETITHILQPYNIPVSHKLITTLQQLLTKVKDKDKPEDRQRAVYKIKCCNSQATYIGETGRTTQLTKHKWATWNGDVNNHIAEQHLQTKHQIDWDSDMYYVFYRLLSTTHFRKLVS